MTYEERIAVRKAIDEKKRALLVRCGDAPERERARRRRAAGVVGKHGRAGYANKCRCEVCVGAQRAYKKDWAARRKTAPV